MSRYSSDFASCSARVLVLLQCGSDSVCESTQIQRSGDLGVPSSQTSTLVNTWIIGRLSATVEDDDAKK
ncbi:hypothetical protein HanXRQr2_Chr16g0740621 [Helianthus annuus]|uniref:Uncharacterized protein n=1 Tax=Helianthus annuus TaxID=4232 RepID=A0A251RXD7_HELAN|nr:hypothetical protein HanXRQr2_Chr16g0740621 [Helianthus annuus]KAJ0437596.1 hypothetical protein HanHA300_Chr16g0603991 [Helianthus annuus]KAJ0459923.1 hypothetical protein HanHA89_Chr16g0654631 [Helianthus annuus]